MLVCKRWTYLCLENPPQLSEMAIQLRNIASPRYLSWLAKSATRAEKLHLTTLGPQPPSMEYSLLRKESLHDLLTRLSICSPKLGKLSITCPQNREVFNDARNPGECAYQWQGYIWHHWAESLQLMRQVEHLHLSVEFVPVTAEAEPISFCPPPQDFFRGMALQARPIFSASMPVSLWLA